MNNIKNTKAVLENKKFNKTAFFLSILFFPIAYFTIPIITIITRLFTTNEDILILLSTIIITLIYVFVFLKYKSSSIEKYTPKSSLKILIFKGIILGISFILINIIISIIIKNIFGIELISHNTEELAKKIKASPYIFIISTVILAPILEELQFKAGIFTLFHELLNDKNKLIKTILPAIISSFIFAYMHDKLSLVFIKYFISSYISCLVYKNTHSIIPCIIAHLLNNLLAVIVFILI